MEACVCEQHLNLICAGQSFGDGECPGRRKQPDCLCVILKSSNSTSLNFAMSTTPVDPVRSRIMSSVRQANTKPELTVRSAAHSLGFRFRVNRKDLPGQPDIVFPKSKKVIFVHGCFWHLR